MIIHWSEYTHGGTEAARLCALHGETADGHRFHICAVNTAEPETLAVELWVESAGGLDFAGEFPSETAARIHAERLAVAG